MENSENVETRTTLTSAGPSFRIAGYNCLYPIRPSTSIRVPVGLATLLEDELDTTGLVVVVSDPGSTLATKNPTTNAVADEGQSVSNASTKTSQIYVQLRAPTSNSDTYTEIPDTEFCSRQVQDDGQINGQGDERQGTGRTHTCMRCGAGGHRARGCKGPFAPISRFWPIGLQALARRLREDNDIPIEWRD